MALATPWLWSHIRVSPEVSKEWLEMQLARSQISLLEVNVQFNLLEEPIVKANDRIKCISELMGILAAEVERWRVCWVSIYIVEDITSHAYYASLNAEPEILDSLTSSMNIDERMNECIDAITTPIQHTVARRMERLYIDCLSQDCCLKMFMGGMPVLTHLYLAVRYRAELWGSEENTEIMKAFLRRANSVTHVYTGRSSTWLSLLAQSTAVGNVQMLCPRLCTLACICPWCPEEATWYENTLWRRWQHILKELLETRAAFGAPITELRLPVSESAVGKVTAAINNMGWLVERDQLDVKVVDADEEERRIDAPEN